MLDYADMAHGALSETVVPGKLSLDEWFALPEDEPGELVDGHLVEDEVPSYVHEVLVALLARLIGNWLIPRGGLVACSDAKFMVGPERGRKPDLTAYFPGTRFPSPSGVVSEPPDIAVEVVSPTPRDGRRDRVDKVRDYAAFKVRYYWILDPQLRSLEVLELGPGERYTHALGASAGKIEAVPGCPGLTLDLDELWSMIDRLEAHESSEEAPGV